MSTAPLDLKIAVIGANKLDALVKRMDALEGEVARLNKTLPRASNNIKKVGTASASAATQTSKFSRAVGGLATAFASFQVGAGFAEAVKDARALELSGRRLKLLTSEYSQFNGVQKEAERLATKFQVSVADSSKALFSLGSRLGSQGTTLEEIVSVYEGLNSALIVTGRSAQEAASANYQLSQALGSGKLTGDELRTIVETLPELLNEIAKQAGKTASEIRQMAKDGELTTDVIIKATKALGDKYAKAVEGSITVNQKFQNSIQGVSEKIGQSLLPVVDPLQEALIEVLNVVIQLPDPIIAVGTAAVAAAVGIGALQVSLSLLGLTGVIGLLGKLATALAGVAGVTTSVVTGFTAAGAAVKATTLVVTAQTVAFGALKIAMLALPWVAAVAGLAAVTVWATRARAAHNELQAALKGGTGSVQDLETATELLNSKISTAEAKLRQLKEATGESSSATKIQTAIVAELKGQLEGIRGRYDAIITLTTIRTDLGDVQPIKDFDTLTPGELDEALGRGAFAPPDLPKGGGGGGGAPRESDAPQLQRDLKLAQDLFALNTELIEAELNRNKLRIEGIEITKIGLETAKEIADVKASDLYADEKLLEIEKLKVAEAEKLLGIQKDGVIAKRDKEEADAKSRADALRPLQEQRRILDAILIGKGEEERLAIEIENIMKSAPGLQRSVVEELVRGNAELTKQAEQAAELEALYDQVSKRIQSGIVDGIVSAIDGTKELSEILADVLKDVGKMFLQFAVKSAFSGMGFAEGGRPPMNKISLIGERGPELFVPDSAGTVISNKDAFGAARGAMRGSNNSSDDAFAENAEAIGTSTSYTKEKVMERERIASINSNPIDVRAETTVINNIEYVTVEQFSQGMKSTARDAQAKVLNDLRNRPATRAQVGIR